jgi:hypothetical protein
MPERLVPLDEAWEERHIGATARDRLTWLLEQFLPADLGSATTYEWALWYQLADAYPSVGETSSSWLSSPRRSKTVTIPKPSATSIPAEIRRLATRTGMRFPLTVRAERPPTERERTELVDCQRRLRQMLEDLIEKGWFSKVELGAVEIAGMIRPPRLGESRSRLGLFKVLQGSMLARMTLATLDYLAEVGVIRLRRCPFRENRAAPPCAKLFLARKGQKFCSPRHTQRAMYLRWVGQGMPRGTRGARGSRRKAG